MQPIDERSGFIVAAEIELIGIHRYAGADAETLRETGNGATEQYQHQNENKSYMPARPVHDWRHELLLMEQPLQKSCRPHAEHDG